MAEIPKKVFIETSALYQLGSKLEKPEFAELAKRRELLEIELLVAEVSWSEYIRQRRDMLDDLAADLDSAVHRLSNWGLDCKLVKNSCSEVDQFHKELDTFYAAFAKGVGIQILPLPDVKVSRLMQMSINRIAPFEESKDDKKEKGFRDALIMFTILENIKGHPEYDSLVITNDRLLEKGLSQHLSEFKTMLTVVPTVEEAVKRIDARMGEWYRSYLLQESEQAKEMLSRYSKEIVEQIGQVHEVTDWDLGTNSFRALLGGEKALLPGESIEEVKSLKLDGIEAAVWRNKDKPRSRILFRIRSLATVLTKTQTSSLTPTPRRFVVGEGPPPPYFLNSFISPRSSETRERVLTVWLYGEAKFESTDGDWKLSSMRVDRSQPSSEEMADLSRVPRRREAAP